MSDQLRIADNFNDRRAIISKCFIDGVLKLNCAGDLNTFATTQISKGSEAGIVQVGCPDLPLTGTLLFGYLTQLCVIEQKAVFSLCPAGSGR